MHGRFLSRPFLKRREERARYSVSVYSARQPDGQHGWYAVRTNGELLAKGRDVAWFATAEDACAAVEKELHTPVDADPFVNTQEQWCWIKLRSTQRAA
jgi:hypothetical protein